MPYADITHIEYEPDLHLMPVTFDNRVTATYFDVPLEIYRNLLAAPTPTEYFRAQVMERYHCSIT